MKERGGPSCEKVTELNVQARISGVHATGKDVFVGGGGVRGVLAAKFRAWA